MSKHLEDAKFTSRGSIPCFFSQEIAHMLSTVRKHSFAAEWSKWPEIFGNVRVPLSDPDCTRGEGLKFKDRIFLNTDPTPYTEPVEDDERVACRPDCFSSVSFVEHRTIRLKFERYHAPEYSFCIFVSFSRKASLVKHSNHTNQTVLNLLPKICALFCCILLLALTSAPHPSEASWVGKAVLTYFCGVEQLFEIFPVWQYQGDTKQYLRRWLCRTPRCLNPYFNLSILIRWMTNLEQDCSPCCFFGPFLFPFYWYRFPNIRPPVVRSAAALQRVPSLHWEGRDHTVRRQPWGKDLLDQHDGGGNLCASTDGDANWVCLLFVDVA